VRKADNLPPSCAVVAKSGNLNFLGPPPPRGLGTGLLYHVSTIFNNFNVTRFYLTEE